eukprot:TRINITY_DN2929_c0_g2_i1.p1 TRINITY_DN2929_c0_g2~~TRINITY_DN2929_c0_g2_i1.p1  ORF type:complete len:610 (+),score=164.36 TRINITY_DN2929_c0_g2_i1:131-1960(+)
MVVCPDGGGAVAGSLGERLSSRDCFGDHSEATMQSFFKHQMMVILQPFLDHIQAHDAKLLQLDDQFRLAEERAADTLRGLDASRVDLLDLRTELKKTNTQVAVLNEAVERCSQQAEEVQQGREQQNGALQRIHDRLQETDRVVPQMQRHIADLESENLAIKTQLSRTNDGVVSDLQQLVQRLGRSMEDVKNEHAAHLVDFGELRKDVDHKGQLLAETRQVLDGTRTFAAGLQKRTEDLAKQDAELSGRLEGWKGQWSKLHPAMEAMHKDMTLLSQRYEHYESVVQTLQQGHATTSSTLEALKDDCGRQNVHIQAHRESLDAAKKELTEARDSLQKAEGVAGQLQLGLHRADVELSKVAARCDSLEGKHMWVCEELSKSSNSVGEIARDHRKLNGSMQALKHDVDKANDSFCSTRGALEATNNSLRSLRDDLHATNMTVHKLGQSVESFRAGFTGLQRGFVDAGNHLQSRPAPSPSPGGMLPRLPPAAPPHSSPSPRGFSLVAKAAAAQPAAPAQAAVAEEPPALVAQSGTSSGGSGGASGVSYDAGAAVSALVSPAGSAAGAKGCAALDDVSSWASTKSAVSSRRSSFVTDYTDSRRTSAAPEFLRDLA